MRGRPLEGKTVLVTRPEGRSDSLAGRLRKAGARVLELPAIRIVAPADPGPLKRAVRRFLLGEPRNGAGYDLVVFTSANGVRRFFALVRAARPRRLPRTKFAAIGPKTGAALREEGVRAASWPSEHRAEALAAGLKVRRGERVLFPRAAKARDVLPRALASRGAKVEAVEAYRTIPDARAAARLGKLLTSEAPPDWITFTSASTVESLSGHFSPAGWRRLFRRSKAASIGPITSAALRRSGVHPSAQAEPYTSEGLARAILRCA